MITTNPFPKGPPRYQFVAHSILAVEFIVAAIGQRIVRCLEHGVPLRYVITCGDDDTATLFRLMLKGKGLDPHVKDRKSFREGGGRHRPDCIGEGPIVFGVIPVDHLPHALEAMGPKAKPGQVIATAQVAQPVAAVAAEMSSHVANEMPQ